MRINAKITVVSLLALAIVCVVVMLAWQPWNVSASGDEAYAAARVRTEDASTSADTRKPDGAATSVADAALTEEGFAALFPEGIEVISSGPSRDEFKSDEEWEHYWGHFHEIEVALNYSSVPVVKDVEGRQHIPGEILLYANERMSDEEIISIVESRGLHSANLSRLDGADTVTTVYSDDISANVDELCERFDDADNVTVEVDRSAGNWLDNNSIPSVKFGHQTLMRGLFNSRLTASAVSVSDPLINEQIYLTHAKFDGAWSKSKCNKSASIAVLDTELDLIHSDLAGSLGTSGQEGTHPGGCGHGTSVAGVACAEADNSLGVAGCSYNAKLVPVSAALADGTSNFTYLYNALQYVQKSLAYKPDVINISQSIPASALTAENIVRLDAVIATLVNVHGCVVVASTGNVEGSNELRYPAACPYVIGVGAVNLSDSHMSGYVSNKSVDLCALGDHIYTTTDPTSDLGQGAEYASQSRVGGKAVRFAGTSYAAPQVSAAAALLKAKHPDWTPALVERALEESARKVSGMKGSPRTDAYGYGVLDASAALDWAASNAPKITAGCVTYSKSVSNIVYTGKAKKPTINVTVAGRLLTKDIDYTVAYSANVNAGTAKVIVTGKGIYSGSATKTFKIKPSPLSNAQVDKLSAKDYTGSAQTQSFDVMFGTKKLKRGTDYTVAYSNNVNVGKATVTIKGKGNFTGAVEKKFSIEPFYPAFLYKVLSDKSGTMKLSCTLKSAPKSPVTRLRVYYGASEKDLKTWKHFVTAKVNLKKKGAVGTIVLKLKSNTKYRLAATVGITSGGKDYYSR